MVHTVQDVKFALHSIMDKFVGNNQEHYTSEEISVIIFAFESNVLFDGVAQKFLPSLRNLPNIPDVVWEKNDTEEDIKMKTDIRDERIKERSDMLKVILLAVFKTSMLRELSIRFGT